MSLYLHIQNVSMRRKFSSDIEACFYSRHHGRGWSGDSEKYAANIGWCAMSSDQNYDPTHKLLQMITNVKLKYLPPYPTI
jgi:hypothetical protein